MNKFSFYTNIGESVKMFSPKSIDIIYGKIDFIYNLC